MRVDPSGGENTFTCCGVLMTGVELPDVYDGVCLWLCGARCGVWRHRFSPGDARRRMVQEHMARLAARPVEAREEDR